MPGVPSKPAAECGVKRPYGAGHDVTKRARVESWDELNNLFYSKSANKEARVLGSIGELDPAKANSRELCTVLAGLMKARVVLTGESSVVLREAAQLLAPKMHHADAGAAFVSMVGLGLEVPDALLARVTQVACLMNEHQVALVAKALPASVPEETVMALARAFVALCQSGKIKMTYDFWALVALLDLGATLSPESVRILETTAEKLDLSKVPCDLEAARGIVVVLGVLRDHCAAKSLLEALGCILRSDVVSKGTVTAKVAFLAIAMRSHATVTTELAREIAQEAVRVAAAELRRMSGVERFAVLRACLSLGVALPDGLLCAVCTDADLSREVTSMSRAETTRLIRAFVDASESGASAPAPAPAEDRGAAQAEAPARFLSVVLALVEDLLVSWSCEMTQEDLVHALRLYFACGRRVPAQLAERLSILDLKQLLFAIEKDPCLNRHDLIIAALETGLFDAADQRDVKRAIYALTRLGEVEGNERAIAELCAHYRRVRPSMSIGSAVNTDLCLVWNGIEIEGLSLTQSEVDMLDGASVAKLLLFAAVLGREPNPHAVGRFKALMRSSQADSRHIARVAVALAVCCANGGAVDCAGLMGCIRDSDADSIGSVELALLPLALRACPSLGPLSPALAALCAKQQESLSGTLRRGLEILGLDVESGPEGLIGLGGHVLVLHENRASVALYSALFRAIGLKHVALSASEYGLNGLRYLRHTLRVQSTQSE